jgi:hypothetical protein
LSLSAGPSKADIQERQGYAPNYLIAAFTRRGCAPGALMSLVSLLVVAPVLLFTRGRNQGVPEARSD